MEYRRQFVELREAGAAKEQWANDRRRLEDQLRKKDEELRTQEEELMKSRSNLLIMCIVHIGMTKFPYHNISFIVVAMNSRD